MKVRKNLDPDKCCAMRCMHPPTKGHKQPDGTELWWCAKHSAQVYTAAQKFNVHLEAHDWNTTLVKHESQEKLAPAAPLGHGQIILSEDQLTELNTIKATVENDLKELSSIELRTPDEITFAEGERKAARQAVKRWEDLRKSVGDYWRKGLEEINGLINPAVHGLKALDQSWSRAINAAKANLAAEANTRSQEALQEAALAAEAGDSVKVHEYVVKASAEIAADDGSKDTYVDNWKFEITDPDKVPREYCCPDVRLIKETVKALRDSCVIPGVRVYNEPYARSK